MNRSLDKEKRTASLHGHIKDDTQTNHFSPGMYVEATIYTQTDSSYSLPETAVANINNQFYVLYSSGSPSDTLQLEKREVQVGATTDGFLEIINYSDFSPNSKFLSKGAFKLIT